jgi:FixJ family two-component response regulator
MAEKLCSGVEEPKVNIRSVN